MKYLLSGFLIVSILYSCTIPPKTKELANWENKIEKEEILRELECNEYYSGYRNDSAIFNLKFGMTEPEVKEALVSFGKNKIISNVSHFNSVLSLDFNFDYNEYTNFGKAYCFFNNCKLSEIQIDTTNQLKSNLINLFIQKYGDYNYYAEIDGNYEYHWVNGNRHISITRLGESKNLLILYKDTSIELQEENSKTLEHFRMKEGFNKS